jgi:A/G-specific adenine glycosylase
LQSDLLTWSEATRRDLPWRRTRDPWAVLVSELMLQQTQVSRVIPKWHAFLARFPAVRECAAAPAGDVVRMWAGLGYNRRALSLHRAAQVCVDQHEGQVPATLDDLLALPGVGAYTARAVLAFAYEHDVAVLDVNASRVLARAFGVADQPDADALVPTGSGWAWNQAVLDLGATTCVKTAPRCHACPLGHGCRWGGVGDDPAVHPPRQSAFAGSDRQGRGRLVDALRLAPVAIDELPSVMGWPAEPDRAQRVAETLVADGLAVREGRSLRLP